jgi:hypothetical protein
MSKYWKNDRPAAAWLVCLASVGYHAHLHRMRKSSLIIVLLCAAQGWPQSAKEMAAVTGSWEGESKCIVANSPCHDEQVLYQISADRKDPEQLNLDGYKIVDGAPEFMGSLACRYRPKQGALSCSANTSQHDDWEFHIFGEAMTGKLTLDNGKTLYRRITVHRSQLKGN